MAARTKLVNRTAVVTGAAAGIGRAISLSLARRGCHLALGDVNETGLADTAQMAAATGVRITRHPLDVADRARSQPFQRRGQRGTPAAVCSSTKAVGGWGGRSRGGGERSFCGW